MPRIKFAASPEAYRQTRAQAASTGDNNFCSPVAVSLLTDTPVEVVAAMMEEWGRKKGQGTYNAITNKVLDQLGFKRVRVDLSEVISTYPRPHCDVLKNITTHHPRRFPAAFNKDKRYLAECRGHVLAIVGGEVQDWSINQSLRIITLQEIVRK